MPIPPHIEKYRQYIWYTALFVVIVSLACPTYCTTAHCSDFMSGLLDLLTGWLAALFGGGIYLVWLANPLLLGAFLSHKKLPALSLFFAAGALLVALQFLRGGKVIINEAGHEADITRPQIGYWLWVTSMGILFIGACLPVIHWLKAKSHNKKAQSI